MDDIMNEIDFLRSTATDIETGEPLDDDARPDLYVIDVRRLIAHLESVKECLTVSGATLDAAGDELSLWLESAADLERDGYAMGDTEKVMWQCYEAAKAISAMLDALGLAAPFQSRRLAMSAAVSLK